MFPVRAPISTYTQQYSMPNTVSISSASTSSATHIHFISNSSASISSAWSDDIVFSLQVIINKLLSLLRKDTANDGRPCDIFGSMINSKLAINDILNILDFHFKFFFFNYEVHWNQLSEAYNVCYDVSTYYDVTPI